MHSFILSLMSWLLERIKCTNTHRVLRRVSGTPEVVRDTIIIPQTFPEDLLYARP